MREVDLSRPPHSVPLATSLGGLELADAPPPRSPAARSAVHALALLTVVVTLGYLGWRLLFTVNWSGWWLSVPLFLLEAHLGLRMIVTIVELWDTDTIDPPEPVSSLAPAGLRVAVLITTYDEGPEVLLPTVTAALGLSPAHETWILDDGHRPQVRAMAAALGARYLTRPDNSHAKAGNINHALGVVEADLVAILDADHVPEPDFLNHTLGYFEDPAVALVQTPQEFYNNDSFIHSGGDGFHEEQFFHRVIMPGKNRCNAAFWCGTNAVLRVAALDYVGGVSTSTITEDMHTTLRLHKAGWRTVHHNEVLARGLAPRNFAEFQTQRWRWGAGAMQSVAMENPLVSSGLTPGQRIMYLGSALSWFDSWRTLGFHIVPAVVLLTGVAPLTVPFGQLLAALAVVHLLHISTSRVMSRGRLRLRSTLLFEVLKMPANISSSLIYLRPRKLSFEVTPKGRTGTGRSRHSVPVMIKALITLDVVAWAWATATMAGLTPVGYPGRLPALAGVAWLLINLTFLALAAERIHDAGFGSERRAGHRVGLSVPARVAWSGGPGGGDHGVTAMVEDVSLAGAGLVVAAGSPVPEVGSEVVLTVFLGAVPVTLTGFIRKSTDRGSSGEHSLGIEFSEGQWRDLSRLANALFRAGLTSRLVPVAA